MHILLIEDDYMQGDWITSQLERRFRTKLEKIFSESDFRQKLNQIVSSPPDVFVIDMMLPWAEVGEYVERPVEVRLGGRFDAGFRCVEMLAKHENTKEIPVILYSAIATGDLPDKLRNFPHVRFVPKDSDIDLLVDAIRELIAEP